MVNDCPKRRISIRYANAFICITLLSMLVIGMVQGSFFLNGLTIEEDEPTTQLTPSTTRIMTDSTNATVMGFATNYRKHDYQRFVGSLRKVGYKGHIILAVSETIPDDALRYLQSKNVQIQKLSYEPCTHSLEQQQSNQDAHATELQTCVSPYPQLKHRWGRFPKLRDFLQDCPTCTGPVLVTDVRDTFFQRDPFGDGQPAVEGLQVFQEHRSITTQHWLVEWPVRECKGITFNKPMLCSGTTIGTRQAMLDYLEVMHQEMMLWMAEEKCHFQTNGDDQSIHNYLFWTGKLPFAKAIPNRMGLVHTVGAQGSILWERHQLFQEELRNEGVPNQLAQAQSPMKEFPPGTEDDGSPKNWLREEYDLTDENGFLLDYDGSRSSIVHQYDRFGPPAQLWLDHWSGLVD